MRRALLAAALVTLTAGRCSLLKPKPDAEEQFGNRPPAQTSENADILDVTPPDAARAYFYTNAPVDVITPRIEPATTAPGDSVRVELFMRGALPDTCYELHDVTQTRSANIIDVTLRVRRPQGAVCATVVRPYRFYLTLDGRFAPGAHTVFVNGLEMPFEIRSRRG